MEPKTFDCVEMKRQGAVRIHAELEGFDLNQKMAYWEVANEEFFRHLSEIQESVETQLPN